MCELWAWDWEMGFKTSSRGEVGMEVDPGSPQRLQPPVIPNFAAVIPNFAASLLAIRGLILKLHPQDCGRPHMEALGLLKVIFLISSSGLTRGKGLDLEEANSQGQRWRIWLIKA